MLVFGMRAGRALALVVIVMLSSLAGLLPALANGNPPRTFLPLVVHTVAPPPNSGATPVPLPPGHEPVAPDWLSRCAPNEVPFETQAWWINDFGHVHLGFCAPYQLRLSTPYTLKARLILHNNPGTLTRLQAQIDSASLSQGGQQVTLDVNCPPTATCAWDSQARIDPARFPYAGWHHLRLRAKVLEPDGNELIASTFIPMELLNGKPVQNVDDLLFNGRLDYVAGRGWYTNAGYVYGLIFDPPTAGERVRGIYRVQVRSGAQDNPQPISRFIVKLDATHTSPGQTLYEVAGPQETPHELAIDTTKLANGWHSLLVRAEAANQPGSTCRGCSGLPQTHAGTAKVWFYVQN